MNNYAFIDGQNTYKATGKFPWEFSYFKFYNFLKNQLSVKRAYYYIGLTKHRNSFTYIKLRNAGFQLCLRKPIIYRGRCRYCSLASTCVNYNLYDYKIIKANVDSNLTLGVITKLDKYDKAIIVAGDSDYYCLAKFLVRKNKLKKILLPSRRESSNLFRESKLLRNKIEYLDNKQRLLEK